MVYTAMSHNPEFENNDGERPLVYMRFRPAWTYIDGIREFGRFFCQETFEEPEVAERACMVLQETLENAVKYSSRAANDELELSIGSNGEEIEISIVSTPAEPHLNSLKRELDMLYSRSAEEAYLAAFERASGDPDASARLGLARVRYEGGVDLRLENLDHDRIRVTASGTINRERSAP